MLQQLYFSFDFKAAVCIPILLPFAVPLLTLLIAQLKAAKARRRREKEKKKKKREMEMEKKREEEGEAGEEEK
jgi:hypothetical protein